MTVNELLTSIDDLKQNGIDTVKKIKWLNDVEKLLYENVLSRAADTTFECPVYTEEADSELLVHAPYEDLYLLFIFSKIDHTNQEWTSYNNNITLYNNLFDEFAAYYRRNHMPKG